MTMLNNLKDMRTYLVGAMDRVPDGGISWRNAIKPMLQAIGIKVLDPCSKPVESVNEDSDTRMIIEYYKQTQQYDKIRDEFSHIRNADLRCVDVSDFVIAYINLDVHMCGSYEEIVTANRQKKPVLIWCEQGKQHVPNWLFFMLPHKHMFNNMSDLVNYLCLVDTSKNPHDFERWFFLDKDILS